MVGLRLIVPVEGNDFMVVQIWRRGHTRFTRECHEKECRYDCPKIDHIRSYNVPRCEASTAPIISLTRQTVWFSAGAALLASDWPPRPRQRSDSGGTDEYPVRGCFPVQPMRNGRGILGRCAAMTPAPTHMTCLAHAPSTSNAENLGDGADRRSAVCPSYDQARMTLARPCPTKRHIGHIRPISVKLHRPRDPFEATEGPFRRCIRTHFDHRPDRQRSCPNRCVYYPVTRQCQEDGPLRAM